MRARSRATWWRWGSPRALSDLPPGGIAVRGVATARASQRRVISRREGLRFHGDEHYGMGSQSALAAAKSTEGSRAGRCCGAGVARGR